MKKILPLFAALFLLVGCKTAQSAPESTLPAIPQDLIGTWVSADPGELDMVETIVFSEDGSFSVQCDYHGMDAGTISGDYVTEDDHLICNITAGTSPYTAEYTFRVDGRELVLTQDGSDAHYLRNS